MAQRVSVIAITGSHHAVAPMAMRLGIASGAVAGKKETHLAHVLSGLPIAANEMK